MDRVETAPLPDGHEQTAENSSVREAVEIFSQAEEHSPNLFEVEKIYSQTKDPYSSASLLLYQVKRNRYLEMT